MFLAQPRQISGEYFQIAPYDLKGVTQLQDKAGIDDILGRDTIMDVFSGGSVTGLFQRPHGRDQRMLGDFQVMEHKVHIDMGEFGFGRDLIGGRLRDHAQPRLNKGKGRFHVQPSLHTVFIVEDPPHFFGGPRIFQKHRVENTGTHHSVSC